MQWYWVLIVCTTIIVVVLLVWCIKIMFGPQVNTANTRDRNHKNSKLKNNDGMPTARQKYLHTIVSAGSYERSSTFNVDAERRKVSTNTRDSINSYKLDASGYSAKYKMS